MSGELCQEKPHFESIDGPCHPTSAMKGAWFLEGHFFPAEKETSKANDHQLEELTLVFSWVFVLKLLLTYDNCIRNPCLVLHVLVRGSVIGRLREGPEILEVLEDGDVRLCDTSGTRAEKTASRRGLGMWFRHARWSRSIPRISCRQT